MPRRLCTGIGLLLSCMTLGCASDGNFTLLGYTTAPNYDSNIRTVFVPIFGNQTFLRGIEFETTKAVIREIEAKTPYKVVSSRGEADTELVGVIKGRRKAILGMNQLGEVREAEVGLIVEVVWKDLRSGETLSVPNGIVGRRDASLPPVPIPPVVITPSGSYIAELGGSNASAQDALAKQLARQIVHMMETWEVKH